MNSVILEFTEIEADFVAKAVSDSLEMMLLMSSDPFLTPEQVTNINFKIESLQQILQKLVNA